MRILSWNVAGLRATIKKQSLDFLMKEEEDIDVVCLQETKCEESEVKLPLMDYRQVPTSILE